MRSLNMQKMDDSSSLHLTILSSEILKTSLFEVFNLSISCEISEVPKVNCVLLVSVKSQDLGAIGSITFEQKRPRAAAQVNLPLECFKELQDLLLVSPPRPASIYLKTSKFHVASNGEILITKSNQSLDIYDLSWRYPIL